MSDPDDECIVDRGRVLRPSRKTGETSPQQFTRGRASAKRFTRPRRGCPFPPASGLPIHRNLPAPPLALGDCGASARALGGLPGGEEETLRVPSSRTAAKRRGAPRTEAAAAIEEGGEGKGAAGGASPEGVRADARARGIGHPLRPTPLASLAGGPRELFRAGNPVVQPKSMTEIYGCKLLFCKYLKKVIVSQFTRGGRTPKGGSTAPLGMSEFVCPRPRRPAMRPFGAALPPPCSAPRTGPQRRAARGAFRPKTPVSGR